MINSNTDAQWLKALDLTADQKKRLSIITRAAIDSETFNKFVALLDRITKLQQFYGSLESACTQKEFKDQLISLEKHCKAIDKIFKQMPSANKQIFDQSCWYTSQYDSKYIKTSDAADGCRVQQQNLEHLSGARFHLENMSKPSKQRYEFAASIAELARGFPDVCPNHKPVNDSTSIFYNLVVFWLHECIGLDILEPKRHIDKAFELMDAPPK